MACTSDLAAVQKSGGACPNFSHKKSVSERPQLASSAIFVHLPPITIAPCLYRDLGCQRHAVDERPFGHHTTAPQRSQASLRRTSRGAAPLESETKATATLDRLGAAPCAAS